jgi:hypothetical protein
MRIHRGTLELVPSDKGAHFRIAFAASVNEA